MKFSAYLVASRLVARWKAVSVNLILRKILIDMSSKTQHWKPLSYLQVNNDQHPKEKSIAVIVLNRPLCEKALKTLWRIASVTICVDGGANRLYDITTEGNNDDLVPQYITGDFDSIKTNVMDYYKQKGVKVVCTPDQDDTDFTKAIKHLVSIGADQQISAVIALGEFSGRLDHTMGNIDTLFIAKSLIEKPVIYLSNDCLAFLLQPGKHRIDVSTGLKGGTCGLIPIGGRCDSVTTKGLKWNTTNTPLAFGELISTSNAFDGSGFVEIETSHHLLWTMETKSG